MEEETKFRFDDRGFLNIYKDVNDPNRIIVTQNGMYFRQDDGTYISMEDSERTYTYEEIE